MGKISAVRPSLDERPVQCQFEAHIRADLQGQRAAVAREFQSEKHERGDSGFLIRVPDPRGLIERVANFDIRGSILGRRIQPERRESQRPEKHGIQLLVFALRREKHRLNILR
jgi:hypothetical protein